MCESRMSIMSDCRLVNLIGEKYWKGDVEAKERLLALLEDEISAKNELSDPQNLKMIAASFLLDRRTGPPLTDDEKIRFVFWQTDNPELFARVRAKVEEVTLAAN